MHNISISVSVCVLVWKSEWDDTLPGAVHHRCLNRRRGGRKCTPARHGRRKRPLRARAWFTCGQRKSHTHTHWSIDSHRRQHRQPVDSQRYIARFAFSKLQYARRYCKKKLSQHFTHTHTHIMTTDSYETFSKYCRQSNSVKLTFFILRNNNKLWYK